MVSEDAKIKRLLVWFLAYEVLEEQEPGAEADDLAKVTWQKNMYELKCDLYLAIAGLGTQALLYCLIYYKYKVWRIQDLK